MRARKPTVLHLGTLTNTSDQNITRILHLFDTYFFGLPDPPGTALFECQGEPLRILVTNFIPKSFSDVPLGAIISILTIILFDMF